MQVPPQVSRLIGELPEFEREPGSERLVIVVGLVGALALLLGQRFSPARAFFAADSWAFAVYGLLPLLSVAWLELRDRAQARWPLALATLGSAALLAAPIASKTMRQIFKAEPGWLLLPAGILSALLVYGLVSGGADLKRWGIGLGDRAWWVPRVAVAGGLVLVLVTLAVWLSPDIRTYYPRSSWARSSLVGLLGYQASAGIYLLSWEFFFRGYLGFGLARRGDALLALMVQAFPFFLVHMEKPALEMAASFVGALLIGWFCLRARSFLPGWILHWWMNFATCVLAFAWRQLC